MFPKSGWIYYTYPSGEEPLEKVWKEKTRSKTLDSDGSPFCLSYLKLTNWSF